MKLPTRLFVLLPFLLLTAAWASGGEFSIEPGAKIGKILLGAQRAEVMKILGTPSGHYKVGAQTEADYWESANSHNTLRVWYQGGGVVQISVMSPDFKTQDGLSSGSALDQVQKSHPGAVPSNYFVHGSGGGLIRYYDDQKTGITFEFTAPESDAPQYQPFAILVHRPGKAVIPEPDEAQRK